MPVSLRISAIEAVNGGMSTITSASGRRIAPLAPGEESGPHWFHRAVFEAISG